MRVSVPGLRAALVALTVGLTHGATPAQLLQWDTVIGRARGQTVNWNAWAGDEKTNAFIAWVGEEVNKRHGVRINHVKLQDTAEAVTRVTASTPFLRFQTRSW